MNKSKKIVTVKFTTEQVALIQSLLEREMEELMDWEDKRMGTITDAMLRLDDPIKEDEK